MKLHLRQSEKSKIKIKVKDIDNINNDHLLNDLQIGNTPETEEFSWPSEFTFHSPQRNQVINSGYVHLECHISTMKLLHHIYKVLA